ncbi:MAG: TonB-dependent receptor plug domain-containing protein [Cognaticolwellia sp.]
MFKKSSTAVFVLITYTATANTVDLESNDEPAEIITITAERLAVSELLSPYSTSLIYQDELTNKGIRTTVDALADISGIFLQKTAHGQGSPYIRGFTGFRNVFLMDGIRLNNSVFREGPNQYWNTVDPYSVAKFEVVKGPTSVVYGSDAIGGTVNAISKLQVLDDFDSQPTSSLLYRGATAEQSNVIRASFSNKLTEYSGLSIGVSGKDYGNLIAGGSTNEQANTSYDEFNVDFKWLMALSDDVQLTTAYFKTKQNDVPRTHKTVHAISFAGTTVGSELTRDLDQERELLYFKLDSEQQNFLADQGQLTLSYQTQNELRNRIRTNNRTDQQGFDVNTVGINLNLIKKINLHNLVYGIEYYRDDVNSFSSKNSIQGPIADDAHYQWFGIYGQNKYFLNDKTSIDFGTRWSYMRVNANKIQDPQTGDQIAMKNHWDNLVFNLRANFQLKPKTSSVYVGISQGFRAPNLSDLTRFDSARSNEFEIPALQLSPEHYVTFDSGMKYRSTNFNYDFSIYYTEISDQIQRVPTGNMNNDGEFEITKKNIGNGYTYGGEFDMQYALSSQVKVTARLAYISGKVETFPYSDNIIEREYLSRLMPTNMTVGVTYSSPSDPWWLNSEITAFDAGDRLSTRDKSDSQRIPPTGTPGFAVWDISGGYAISSSMQLTVNVQNILDKNYRIHGSGQNEAGINLVASIEYQF